MKRDWDAFAAKLEEEFQICRVCQREGVDAAHIIPRSRVSAPQAEDPRNCAPLCRVHHTDFDRGALDLLPHLTREEQSYAVWLVGLEEARRRLTGER